LKIIILIGGGRSGIDLLQSLFDQHSQVSQFPGVFNWSEFYNLVKNEKSFEKIAKIFIKQYDVFFNSKKNKRERHDKLGIKKNLFYEVSEKKFVNYFKNKSKGSKTNKKNILNNLHLAYSFASGESIRKKKFIIINLHSLDYIKDIDEFNYKILYTIRDPLVSLSSGFKHWLDYKNGSMASPWSIYFHIERQFNALKKLSYKRQKTHVIKLEELHQNSKKTLKKLCKFTGLKYKSSLLTSTYHNKKWWGDSLSKKYLNGLNKNFKNKIYFNIFYKKDIFLLKKYLEEIYKKYKYENNFIEKEFSISLLTKFIPLKIELILFYKQMRNLKLLGLISSFYYYFKRVNLMKKNSFHRIKLPKY
tara:strand:- start:190 stop:1269 length:1080 start_codon:yes stop_codon:yes gene_type:complete